MSKKKTSLEDAAKVLGWSKDKYTNSTASQKTSTTSTSTAKKTTLEDAAKVLGWSKDKYTNQPATQSTVQPTALQQRIASNMLSANNRASMQLKSAMNSSLRQQALNFDTPSASLKQGASPEDYFDTPSKTIIKTEKPDVDRVKVNTQKEKINPLATMNFADMTPEDKAELKRQYESLDAGNVAQRLWNQGIRNQIKEQGGKIPEDYPDYTKAYNEKQQLSKNYNLIKSEEAHDKLLANGMTEDELRDIYHHVLEQDEIDDLYAQGMSEDEVIQYTNDLYDRGERARQKLYDLTQNLKDDNVSYDEYMNMLSEYYDNPEIVKDAQNHPVANSIFSVVTNPIESVAAVGKNLIDYATGKPIRRNDTYTDLTRQTVNEQIENPVGRFFYNTGLSAADSAYSQAIGLAIGGGVGRFAGAGLQGFEKGSQVMNDAVDKGLTPNRIMLQGVSSGLTTFLSELIPMGKLSNIAENGLSKYTAKELAKVIGAQMVTEGAQEGVEDVFDWIADGLIAWDKSDINLSIANYMAEGDSHDMAVLKTIRDKGLELAQDVLGGALSAPFIGGGAAGYAYAQGKYSSAPSVQTDVVMNSTQAKEALAETVKNIDSTNASEEMAQRIEYAKELANKPIEELSAEDVVDMANVAQEQANETNNIAQSINEINYQANIENNLKQYEQTGTIEKRENELPVERLARERAESIVVEAEKEQQRAFEQKQKQLLEDLKKDAKPVEDFKMNEDIQNSLEEASEGFENDVAAKTFIENYNGSNLALYTEASYLAYRAGESGQNFDKFLQNAFIADLMVKQGGVDKAYLKNLYYNGLNARTTEDSDINLRKNENRGFATGLVEGDKLAEFKKALAKKFNIEVFTDRYDAKMRGDFSANLARLTVNATSDNEYAAIVHEMFEFARSYNPKGMETAEKALVNMIVERTNEAKFVDAVLRYREAYRKAGREAAEGSSLRSEANKSFSEAQEEFINDAISYVFSTDEGMKTLVDYIMSDEKTAQKEKVSAIQAIKDWVDKLITSIKDFISGHKTNNLGYNYAKDANFKTKELESLSRMLTGVLDTARENLAAMSEEKTTEKAENSEKVAHSLEITQNLTTEEHNLILDELFFKDNANNQTTFKTKDGNIGVRNNRSIYIVDRMNDTDDPYRIIRIYDVDVSEISGEVTNTSLILAEIEENEKEGKGITANISSACFALRGLNGPRESIRYYDFENMRRNTEYHIGKSGNTLSTPIRSNRNVKNRRRNFEQRPGYKKYSLAVDSEGNELTKGQQEYFKDSKIVDENGNLKVMYHGTNSAGFTVFERSDDGISFFFTDNKKVASTYSRVDYFENPDKPMSFEELSDAAESVTDGSFREENGKIIFEDYDGTTKAFKSIKDAQNWLIDEYIEPMTSQGMGSPSNYEVYLNAKNPLVVDANGSDWNDLPAQSWNKHYGDVDITYSDGTYEVEYMDGETFEWHHDVFDSKKALENKFGKIPELNGFSTAFLSDIYLDKKNQRVPTTTREYAEYAKNNGYDSVIFNNIVDNGMYVDNEIESQVVVVFNSNQVKSIYNENPTDNPDIRFSLDVPVEESDDLIAVHNMHEEELKKTIALGGFPMPSIAITKANMGHDMYGDISVLFNKDTIDPKKSKANKVYSGDAYTPEFPRIVKKIDKQRLLDLEEKLGLSGDYYDVFQDDYEDVLRRLLNNNQVKEKFIKDSGVEIEKKPYEKWYHPQTSKIAQLLKGKYFTLYDIAENEKWQKELANAAYPGDKAFIVKLRNQFTDMLKHIADTDEQLSAFLNNNEEYDTETKKDRFYDLYYSLSTDISNIKNGYVETDFDRNAYREDVDNYLKEHEDEFKAFIEDAIKEADVYKGEFLRKPNVDTFLPSGKRRTFDQLHMPITLENIVKIMKSEPATGQGVLGYTFIGSANREFKSIKDIKSQKDRLKLLDPEEYNKLVDDIKNEVNDVAKRLASRVGFDVISTAQDIAEAVAKNKTAEGVKRFLSEWYKVNDADIAEIMALAKRVEELPAGYFEAKPQRAVGFDEVAAVVVPSDDTEMIDLLNEKNIPVKTYERGDKQSRIDAVNSVENVSFSLDVKYLEDESGNKVKYDDIINKQQQYQLNLEYERFVKGSKKFEVSKDGCAIIPLSDLNSGSHYDNIVLVDAEGRIDRVYNLNLKDGDDVDVLYRIIEQREVGGEPYDRTRQDVEEHFGKGSIRTFFRRRIRSDRKNVGSKQGSVRKENEKFDRRVSDGTGNQEGSNGSRPTVSHSIDVDAFMDAFEAVDNDVKLNENELHELIKNRMDLESDVSKKMISEVASNIKKLYNSGIDKKTLERDLTTVFRYLKNTARYSMEDVMTVMTDIAKPILENVKVASPEQEKLYKDFTDFVKGYTIALNNEQMQEVRNEFGSYTNFKRMMAGKMKLDKNGTMLDDVWTEISDRSNGKLSFGTNPNDQPVELARYIMSLNPTYQNLQGQSLDAAATDLALEIFRQFYVQQSMTDAAVKVKDEMSRRSQAMKERYQGVYNAAVKQVEYEKALNMKRLAEEIDNLTAEEQEAIRNGDTVNQALIQNIKNEYQKRYDRLQAESVEKIAKAKANYQNAYINKNLRRERSELKNRLLREVKALQNIIAHPQEGATKHVPVNLIKPTIEMLEAINLDNGGANKTIVERLKKMSEVYESFKNNEAYSFDYDERIAHNIEELQQMFENKSYADLGITELERVIEIVTALKTQIKNANNLILQGRLEDAKKAATDAMKEVRGSRRIDNSATNLLNRYGNMHLNAYREFRKLSGYDDDGSLMRIYKNLDEGSKREMQIQKDLGEIFQDVLEGNENQKEVKKFISTKPQDLVDIGITDKNGKPILITRAMRMSLIMHSMNAGNMRHILGSGITVPNMYYFSKGKLDEAYAKGTNYRFVDYAELLKAIQKNDTNKVNELTTAAQKRIEEMKKDLSPWEQKFLADAEEMFHDETGRIINDVSMKLKGYALARVKNYFPIRTDSHFTQQEWSGLVRDGSLEGSGFLKERVISTKPILLEDITNVVQRQIGSVAKYGGLAIPVRNFETIMKQTFRDMETGKLENLSETIDSVWGASDTKWLRNLMQDIQGGRSEKGSPLMKLRGQFAGATLAMNPSVAIKQAASYPTAAAVVGWKALGRAAKDIGNGFGGKGIEELERINPLLWYRSQGYGTQELADAKAVGFGKKFFGKDVPVKLQKAINWTQWFDTGTVRTLEYAAKYYVDDNFKNLEQGSEAYWEKVSEVFSKIVEETQPNYSTLHKADIIRNPNSFVKMLVMFKTQPMQNFGIIYDAMGELNAAKVKGDPVWIERASSKAARAISSQVVSASVFSAMTILSQLLLHRWWKYRDDDGKWDWKKLLVAFGEGVISCMTGAFIGGSELYEALKHIFTGETYYGIEVSTVEMVNDLVDNIGNLTKYSKALTEANTSEDKEKSLQKILKAGINLGTSAGEFSGTPVGNIKNMLSAMYFYTMDAVRSIDEGELSISDDSKIEKWDIPTQYERIYDAMQSGDDKKYQKLVDELVKDAMAGDENLSKEDAVAKVEEKVTQKILNMMKEGYLEGEVTTEEMQNFLVEEKGKTEDEAYFQMRQWETGESTYGVLKDSISKAAENPTAENRKAMIDEVNNLLAHGKDKGSIASTITSTYKAEYIELYNQGKAADLNAVLRAALVAAGYTDEEAKKKLDGWLK